MERSQLRWYWLLAIPIAIIIYALSFEIGGSQLAFSVGVSLSLVILVPFLIASSVMNLLRLIGNRCPACGGRSMARSGVLSFGPRFYSCRDCGHRRRLDLFRGWLDATDPRFDARFRRVRPENPWTMPPDLSDEVAYSKTHANLLHNKHRRVRDKPPTT